VAPCSGLAPGAAAGPGAAGVVSAAVRRSSTGATGAPGPTRAGRARGSPASPSPGEVTAAQLARPTTIAVRKSLGTVVDMVWLVLEALLAGALLVAIVWWTMFAGRDKGEPPRKDPPGA
jgi:hypothetical protein